MDDVDDFDDDDDDGCPECDGAGGFHDCGEDTCCCADPGGPGDVDWFVCPTCHGASGL